jgi:hypothetical protein
MFLLEEIKISRLNEIGCNPFRIVHYYSTEEGEKRWADAEMQHASVH